MVMTQHLPLILYKKCHSCLQRAFPCLDGLLTDALQSGGRIAERESQIGARVTAADSEMAKLDERAAKLTTRYLSKFTQMETTISTLKSTGNYLTNLVAQWNKSS